MKMVRVCLHLCYRNYHRILVAFILPGLTGFNVKSISSSFHTPSVVVSIQDEFCEVKVDGSGTDGQVSL